jgi:hypothetical protein
MKRIYVIGLCVFFLLLISRLSLAWDSDKDGAHWNITKRVATSGSAAISTSDFHTRLGGTFKDEDVYKLICQGAIDEDFPYTNCLKHFDPKISGGTNASDWAFNDNGNKCNWDNVMKNPGSKDSFRALGHLLHLYQDMCVPAHVRQDYHPDKTLCKADDIECQEKYPLINTDPLEIYAAGIKYSDWPLGYKYSNEGDCGDPMNTKEKFEDFFKEIRDAIRELFYSFDTCFIGKGPDSDKQDKSYFYSGGRKIAYKGMRYYKSVNNGWYDMTKCSIDSTIAKEQWEILRQLVADVTATVMWAYGSMNKLNSFTFKGYVRNDKNQGMDRVNVSLYINDKRKKTVITNNRGKFEFKDIILSDTDYYYFNASCFNCGCWGGIYLQ